MQQNNPNKVSASPGCLGAGGPVWYTVLAVSFLACSLNPVGAAGLAMGILTPHDMYSKPIGWMLTAGSFVIAIMGFIASERVAYIEGRRRALETAGLATCGGGLLAFVLGFTLPFYIMWPIAAVFVLVGALGFRGASSLPIPGMAASGTITSAAANDQNGANRPAANNAEVARDGSSGEPGPKRKRRRRRHRRRRPSGPSGRDTPSD
jgi:hypothetical protein